MRKGLIFAQDELWPDLDQDVPGRPATAYSTSAGDTVRPPRPRQVRLRTLVLLRWLAVAGQAAALLIVYGLFGYKFPIGLAFLAVAASAWLNIALSAHYPASRRLSDRGAAMFLAYDLLQLGALLYFTGGLDNPFAVLFLAPAVISASILSLRATAILVLLTVIVGSLLAVWHQPLPWSADEQFVLPELYLAARWVALTIGVVFLAFYVGRVAAEARRMSDALAATQTALAREQQLSALGGLAAAAAHELGTPLATISLVAKELQIEAPEGYFRDDLILLRSQVERCREILATLARRPDPAEGFPTAVTPFTAMVEQAALPYRDFGTEILVVPPRDVALSLVPQVRRSPEVLHGLGNLIENAAEFAAARVRLDLWWSAAELGLNIVDDGPGFPLSVIDMLGEPYFSYRPREEGGDNKGLGLGVFIAKTLLERTGATVAFSNAPEGGAVVRLAWPRAALAAELQQQKGA
jgi:two-component system sensor histidine kinase RegB